MPQLNIHWKGCPHRYLPRIRLESPHYGTVIGRRYAQLAALNVSRLPYSLDLQKARLQQQIRIRRKKQKIRGSLGGIMASSCSSQLTSSDTRFSILESPQEYLASRVWNSRELGASVFTDQLSESPFHLSGDLLASAKIVSNSSLLPDVRDDSTSSISAAGRVEDLDFKNLVKNEKQTSEAGGQVCGKHIQDAPPERFRKTRTYSRALVLDKSRMCDPRLAVRRARRRTKSTSFKRNVMYQPQTIVENGKLAATDKEPTSTDLPTQKVTSRSISSISTRSALQPVRLSDLPCRTPTQLRALKKFSRGLERHLVAQEAVRKACLSSSLSSSTFSADTIVDFVPYIAEFQAAGLAVTSNEQCRPATQQLRRKIVPLVPKEISNKKQSPAIATEGINRGGPIASHDGSGGGLNADTTSSRTTVIAFSNCGEPNSSVAYPTRNVPIKKALLPWLRKAQEPSLISQSFPPDGPTANISLRSSSGSTCETCATTILDFSPWPVDSEWKQAEPDSTPVGLRPIDVRAIYTDDDSIKGKKRVVLQPIVPERPVPVVSGIQKDGNYSGKISGNKTLALDLSPKMNLQTSTTLAGHVSNEKNVSEATDSSVSQCNSTTIPLEPILESGISLGSFRPSPKLLAQQRSPNIEEPKFVKDAAAVAQMESAHVPSKPPSHSPPSPPRQNGAFTSKYTQQSPDLSVQDQYGFETPSIFELALHDVANASQSLQEQFMKEKRVIKNELMSSSGYRVNDDPVKRRSSPCKPPELSSQYSNAATVSSLRFATSSEKQPTKSIDYSDIRDKDVFKGLQIALAAACNKDLDLWIMKMLGCGVRNFLADLSVFEGLGVNALAEQAKRTAQKRKEERDQEMSGHRYGYVQDHELGAAQERPKDMKEKRRAMRADDSGRRGLLIAQMSKKKDLRACESTRERALALGWRNRSVSAGC